MADSGGAYASVSACGVVGRGGGRWVEAGGGCWKRVRLTRKTPFSGFPMGFERAEAVPRRWNTLSCGAEREDSSVKKRRNLEPDKVGLGHRATGVSTDSRRLK